MASNNDGGRDDENNIVIEEEPMKQQMQAPPLAACVLKGTADALAGAVMGSVFGFGTGLFQRQGFKGALQSGASSAKTFAILSGMHGLVTSLLTHIRGKQDALNAGIAGCATGLVLSGTGNPMKLAQGCLTFGAFSYAIEMLNARPAYAATIATIAGAKKRIQKRSLASNNEWGFSALPPFSLAPPEGGLFIFERPKLELLKRRC